MLRALVVDLPPDPLAIARRLAGRPGLSLLLDDAGGTSYVAVEPDETSRELDPEPERPLAPGPNDLFRAPRWIGMIPYEARRELERRDVRTDPRLAPQLTTPLWQRYAAVVEVGREVRVIGEDAGRVAALARSLSRAAPPCEGSVVSLTHAEPDRVHAERVRAALEHIAKGDVYVINIARKFSFRVTGGALPLLERLRLRARSRYSAALDWQELRVACASPELLLRSGPSGRIETSPIKGTRPRGLDAESDRRLASELERDPKEGAELAMVIDVERNDLGRVARAGSVRLLGSPEVVTLPSVHHRVASVVGELRSGVSRAELLRAVVPSGSVTGAPKVRAMELVREIEADRRGLYTGGIGLVRHDGSLELAMAIRLLGVVGDEGEYFAGGGIVADSDPRRETEETRWKARSVL